MKSDIIFAPLQCRNLTLKNRILRSNTYGNFDNPDGTGTTARLKWEEKFARGGVGAILSCVVPVCGTGRIAPNCATLDRDEQIPFWRQVAQTVHHYDCKYIAQLSYGGSHLGALSQTIAPEKIQQIVNRFADAARRAREARLDGVEVDATKSGTGRLLEDETNGRLNSIANLVGQFLSDTVNHRIDEYGGSFENRSRFLLEIVTAIRTQVGGDFHLQVKIDALETRDREIQLCQWIERAGADALHLGSKLPVADRPSGNFPLDIEGEHIQKVQQIEKAVRIPIFCTGGFQSASYIRKAIAEGCCDAVTIARALIANPNLPKIFAEGKDSPDKPCTYCEKCRLNLVDNPLGCYDVTRYDGDYTQMSREILSVYR
ncbi:NADH:flavin oxidoreductase [Phormidium sp. CCY1219]|uniref:NADH:flavin oxidoreductase n=1 Tax=Phormidium sp. CCY1219 TaxID=2886104 RepID=UPI002D1ECACD|nr:NADH:flavin oxidoreductase [Phormidium sp. CCY1219]MEB3829497.1 NADH:flavin oxidoreductase [Phormidium sp. CCY1219]